MLKLEELSSQGLIQTSESPPSLSASSRGQEMLGAGQTGRGTR